MSEVKRYGASVLEGHLAERPNGDWVMYKDHAAEISALEAKLKYEREHREADYKDYATRLAAAESLAEQRGKALADLVAAVKLADAASDDTKEVGYEEHKTAFDALERSMHNAEALAGRHDGEGK